MSTAAIEIKRQQVAELTEQFRDASSIVVVDYRGLTVSESTELRRSLLAEGLELKVIKNNILKRAAKEAGYEGMDNIFVGPSAVAIGKEDVVAPARIIYDFAKSHEALEFKGGVIEGQVSDKETVVQIAKLPSKDGLLSMLLNVLQAPVRNFALAVKAVAEKDQEQE